MVLLISTSLLGHKGCSARSCDCEARDSEVFPALTKQKLNQEFLVFIKFATKRNVPDPTHQKAVLQNGARTD